MFTNVFGIDSTVVLKKPQKIKITFPKIQFTGFKIFVPQNRYEDFY
jgi:hypothetical protein